MAGDQDEALRELEAIARARAGSVEAFAELVRKHQTAVRAYASRHVRNWDLASDLAQEAFLAAHRSLASYRQEAPFRSWLLGIVRRLIVNHLREEARREAHERGELASALAAWQLDALETAATPAQHEREVEALASCLKKLPRESARMVEAHYFRGQTSVQIARRDGQKDGAVRMALLRVRRLLRDCVDQQLSGAVR